MLETFLDLYRDILKRKLTGLSDQQIRQRHVPSATTLGGLAKHLAAVEREWFQVVLARRPAEELDAPLPFKTTLRVAEALRLPATQLHEVMPARIARKGSTRLLVPVADPRQLDTLAPNDDTLLSLGSELGTDGFFVFALNRSSDEWSTESRMFCPALGIPEDPVSGNAHAMLAAYLWDLGQFGKNSTTFIGRQGLQMKRPGQVSVKLEVDQGRLVAAHIGGTAVIVSEGTLAL